MCSLSFGSFGRQSIWICQSFSSTLIIIQTIHLVNISMSYNLMNWMELLLQIHILEKKRSSVDRTEVLAVWEGCIIFNLITTYSYKRMVKQFRILQITAHVFSSTLYKSICCGYSFELPQLVEAIQMSTHNIWFYKENQKNIAQASLNTPSM